MGSCAEIYREKAFVDAGLPPGLRFVNASRIGETSLMFQVHPTLSREDVERVAAAATEVVAGAAR